MVYYGCLYKSHVLLLLLLLLLFIIHYQLSPETFGYTIAS